MSAFGGKADNIRSCLRSESCSLPQGKRKKPHIEVVVDRIFKANAAPVGLPLPGTSAFSGRRPSRRVRAGGVLAANHPREFAFCSLEKNAYSAGQKTARAAFLPVQR
jgi:hypothetical protein